MTTSTTPATELPVLDDLTTADIRDLIRTHLRVTALQTASARVRQWGIGQGLVDENATRGPLSRALWVAYAVAHRLGTERPPAPVVVPERGGLTSPSRCRCGHLRIHHAGGMACKGTCGCLRFRTGAA